MKSPTFTQTLRVLGLGTLISFSINGYATNFNLSALTASGNKVDLGFCSGDTILSLQMSGQVSLITGWDTLALLAPGSSPLLCRLERRG